MIVASAVAFPLIFDYKNLGGGMTRFIESMFVFVCVFFTMLSLHLKRTALLLFNYDIDKDLQIVKRASVRPEKLQRVKSLLEVPSDMKFGTTSRNPFEVVKSKNLITRRQVCKDQISHWSKVLSHTEAMMLVVFDEADHNRLDVAMRCAVTSTLVPVSSNEP